MNRETNVCVISPFIGNGNPASALSIAYLLNVKSLLLDGLGIRVLRRGHKGISTNPQAIEEYNKKGDVLRLVGGFAIGFLELISWLNKEMLKPPLSDIGIFVQEHILGVLPEELLKKWFPFGVFLAIPDVLPKKSALSILRKKEVVQPVVWNKTAYNELKKQGFDPILTALFLPEGFVGEVDFRDKKLARKIVVKSSGSGMPKEWINSLTGYARENKITIEIWLPDKKISFNQNGQKEEKDFKDKLLEDYLKDFYQSLVDDPPEYLVSFPSEMTQVAAWMRKNGWDGIFATLPPKGPHEAENKKWAEKFLRTLEVNFSNLDILDQQPKQPENNLTDELGEDSIKILLILRRDRRLSEKWLLRYDKKYKKHWEEIAQEYLNKIDEISNFHPKDQVRIIELLLNFSGNKEKGILTFLDLAKRFSQSSDFIKGLYKKALENFSLSQFDENLILKEVLEEAGFSEEQTEDIIDFSFADFDILKNLELIGILAEFIGPLRSLYQINDQDVKRKVNEGLYLRHILRTLVLASEIYNQLPEEKREKIDYKVLIFASLLHDYKELRQKNGKKDDIERVKEQLQRYGFLTEKEIDLIFDLVDRLTPEEKLVDKNDVNSYLEAKRRDFQRVWEDEDENKRTYLRVVKAADVLANFEETVIDLENGKNDGKMKVPKFWRMRVFYERLDVIKKEFPFLEKKLMI